MGRAYMKGGHTGRALDTVVHLAVYYSVPHLDLLSASEQPADGYTWEENTSRGGGGARHGDQGREERRCGGEACGGRRTPVTRAISM